MDGFSGSEHKRRSGRRLEECEWTITAVIIHWGSICSPFQPSPKSCPSLLLEQHIWGHHIWATFSTTPPKAGGSLPQCWTPVGREGSNAAKELVTMEILENRYGNWSNAAHFVYDPAVIVSQKEAYGNMWCSYDLICQALCPSWHHRTKSQAN